MDCSTCRRKRFPNPSRAWRLVRRLRSYYPELVKDDRDTSQLLIGQVRYSVHTLGLYNPLILEDICEATVQSIIGSVEIFCDIDLFYLSVITEQQVQQLRGVSDGFSGPHAVG
jgi:hypothetical protein